MKKTTNDKVGMKLSMGVAALFLEQVGSMVLTPRQRRNWLPALVEAPAGQELWLLGHGTPKALAAQATAAATLSKSASTCPLFTLKVQLCPACCAGLSCDAWQFLKQVRQLTKQLQERLKACSDEFNTREFAMDVMEGYNPAEVHLFAAKLHVSEPPAEAEQLLERIAHELSLKFPRFKVALRWCPDCAKGAPHDEKAFGA